MNRIRLLSLASLAALFAMCGPYAAAQEIYKWTDASGKVHYGDRAAAPDSSKTVHVQPAPPVQPPAAPASSAGSQRRPPLPAPDPRMKSEPADPALVGPQCKALVDRIAAVPRGQSWEALSRQFDSACPGIAYECLEYRSSPQDNHCTWVKRAGNSVLNRKSYP